MTQPTPRRLARTCLAGASLLLSVAASAEEGFSLNTLLEGRYFFDKPLNERQPDDPHNLSFALQPEYYHEWADGAQSFTFTGFGRLDENDRERSHADLRELYWRRGAESFEWRVGVRKVFWGVTESAHLVDIINQGDLVENLDNEDKLGQPMVNLAWVTDFGTFDFFVLPYFRERTFPGEQGRPAPFLVVDTDEPVYESAREEQHVDGAVRYASSFGGWDVGLSYFDGTSREPRLLFTVDAVNVIPNNPPPQCQLAADPALGPILIGLLGPLLAPLAGNCAQFFTVEPVNPHLRPAYDQIRQVGLEVQRLMEGWFLKLEAIHRKSRVQAYTAFATGFEYTWGAVFESALDVSLVLEYLYDDRGPLDENSLQGLAVRKFIAGQAFTVEEAMALQNLEPESFSPFQDDIFIGSRIALNDVQSTEMLIGAIVDRETQALLASIEASRRLGENWKLALEARAFHNIPEVDPLFSFSQDSLLQLELTRYF